MEYLALGIAGVALIVAFIARNTASKLASGIEDAKRDAARRAESSTREVEQKLALMRRTLAQMAKGEKLTPEQILEERLYHDIDGRDSVKLVAAGNVRVVDVRSPQETSSGVIAGAQLIPVDQLESRVREIPKDGKPVLVYCAAGGRSAAACEFLGQQGYDNLYNLVGGFGTWTGPIAKPA
jgi:rhodanese-related sulfurtransferase